MTKMNMYEAYYNKRKEYQKRYYEKNKKKMKNKNLVRNHNTGKPIPTDKKRLEGYINILLNQNARRKPEKTTTQIKKKRTIISFD